MTRRTTTRVAGPALLATFAVVLVLGSPVALSAQPVTNPRIAEFDPSADHDALLSDGQPAVSNYELDVYALGAQAPFHTVAMGKPAPDPDGKIRFDFSTQVSGWPLPGGQYEARVRVVGPEGSSVSAPSNPFDFSTSSLEFVAVTVNQLTVPAGAAVRWTASTSGGVAPLQFRFYRAKNGGPWVEVRAWSTSNTFTWTPGTSDAGAYQVQVWARNADSTTTTYDAWRNSDAVTVYTMPAVSALSADRSGTVAPGTAVRWTATVTGGLAPLQYQFSRARDGGAWAVVRAWSTSNTFSWTPGLSDAGSYQVQVWVRSAGSTAPYDAWRNSAALIVTAPATTPCTTATVLANPPAEPGVGGVETLWQTTGVSLAAGQVVTVTATGTWTNADDPIPPAGQAGTLVEGTNCPLSGQPLLALIGRIGPAGAPFPIGSSRTWTPTTSGTLYVAPQDNWYTTWDNAGSLSVSVCRDAGTACTYSLSSSGSGTVAAAGGSGTFTVTTGSTCAWTPVSSSSWIRVTSGSGPGSAAVTYTVDANQAGTRTGTITAGGRTYTVTQAATTAPATCANVTVESRPTAPPGVGGVDTLWQTTGVTVTAGQPVSVSASGTWTDAGVSLTGAGHPTATVTGTNCPLSGQPLMALVGRIGTTGTPFPIGTSKSWTPATSGVLYLAPQDNWYTTWDNTGSLNVSVCLDAGGSCGYALAPATSGTLSAAGDLGSFTVTTGTGCAWTATTTATWIHLASGAATGSGTVGYVVDANTGAARTGTIVVGGQTFTVSQAGTTGQRCDTVPVLARPPLPPGVGGVETMWQSSGITLTAGQPATITAAGTWSDTLRVAHGGRPFDGHRRRHQLPAFGPAGTRAHRARRAQRRAVPRGSEPRLHADRQRRLVSGSAGQLVHDVGQRGQPQRHGVPLTPRPLRASHAPLGRPRSAIDSAGALAQNLTFARQGTSLSGRPSAACSGRGVSCLITRACTVRAHSIPCRIM